MVAGLVRTVISCSTTFSTPPRLMPGDLAFVLEVHRHLHGDDRIGPDAQEVEMQRLVGHRVDLHVARQDIEALAVDLDLEAGD